MNLLKIISIVFIIYLLRRLFYQLLTVEKPVAPTKKKARFPDAIETEFRNVKD